MTTIVDEPMPFSWFHHPFVAVAERPLAEEPPPLLPQERAFVATAVPARQREFAAGRACARHAIETLGLPPTAIVVAADRTPIWPAGVVGSITHSRTHCAAAVGRIDQGIRAIGLDLEPAEDLNADLVEAVCRPEEIAWLASPRAIRRLLLARAIFSAKECAYKCQFSVSRRPLEFDEVRVDLDLERHLFTATILPAASPFPAGFAITGTVRVSQTHIACAAVLHETDDPTATRPHWHT